MSGGAAISKFFIHGLPSEIETRTNIYIYEDMKRTTKRMIGFYLGLFGHPLFIAQSFSLNAIFLCRKDIMNS